MPDNTTRRIPDGTEVGYHGREWRVERLEGNTYKLRPLDVPLPVFTGYISAAYLEAENPDALREVPNVEA